MDDIPLFKWKVRELEEIELLAFIHSPQIIVVNSSKQVIIALNKVNVFNVFIFFSPKVINDCFQG